MTKRVRKVLAGIGLIVVAGAGFNISHLVQQPADDIKLVLNIPASRIDVFEKGARTRSYQVSVGKRGFETPPGSYRISRITWNPWWHPPKSEWARGEKPTPPGPDNPMGRVKINFANLLYIHGTLYEHDLGAPASHGCIRIGKEDLFDLTMLLHKYRTPNVEPELLATLKANDRMTRDFRIRPVRFEVVYKLVEVVDGKLVIHPDVYRTAGSDLRKEIVGVLKQQGVAITDEVQDRVSRISKTRNVTRLTVAIDTLAGSAAGE